MKEIEALPTATRLARLALLAAAAAAAALLSGSALTANGAGPSSVVGSALLGLFGPRDKRTNDGYSPLRGGSCASPEELYSPTVVDGVSFSEEGLAEGVKLEKMRDPPSPPPPPPLPTVEFISNNEELYSPTVVDGVSFSVEGLAEGVKLEKMRDPPPPPQPAGELISKKSALDFMTGHLRSYYTGQARPVFGPSYSIASRIEMAEVDLPGYRYGAATTPDEVREEAKAAARWKLVDSSSGEEGGGAPMRHGLLAATQRAFRDHHELVLTPEVIWTTIAQGVAKHIKANAERLRRKFVRFDGKKCVKVKVPPSMKRAKSEEFEEHAKRNAPLWHETLESFSAQIRGHIGDDMHNLLRPKLSTESAVAGAAMDVGLMDGMSPYFEYSIESTCAIPRFTVTGTVEDWDAMIARVKDFPERIETDPAQLRWWTDPLLEVLQEFRSVVASGGAKVNHEFWRSFYKHESILVDNVCTKVRREYVSGSINAFFPYLESSRSDLRRNWAVNPRNLEDEYGPAPSDFPAGLSTVDAFYDDEEGFLAAGAVGYAREINGTQIMPVLGYAAILKDKADYRY